MKKIFTFFAALVCAVSMFAAQETVYFVNAQKWTGTINAYAWTSSSNASWPGVAATKEAEQIAGCDIYSYTAEAGTYANIIFNNGSMQTADLKWTAGKYYCKDGWYTKEEVAVKLGQPIEYESVYFVNVQGWSTVKIYTWTPNIGSYPGIDMKKETEKIGGKDVYSYTVEKGTSFGGMLFNCGGDECKTGDLQWTAGKYYVADGWYTKEEATAKLNAGTTPTPTAYYVVGTFNGWANPDPTTVMTEEGGVYTKTLSLVAGECQLKVTNGTWDEGRNWGYDALSEVPVGVTKNNDGNIVFTLAEAGDVKVTFNGEKITLAGNFVATGTPDVPQTVSYVLMGIAGDWNTGIALEQNPADEKEYMLICQTIAEGDAVKVVTVTDGEKTAYCGNVEEGSVSFTSDEHGNIVLSAGIYDFYYKLESDIIYIGKAACDTTSTPEVPENPDDSTTVNPDPVMGVTYDVVVPAGTYACYIAGEMNGWSHTEMTKVDDTHYTLTVDTATTAMKYKYCSGPDWKYVEKTATGEDVVDRTYSANDIVEAWASVYDPNATEDPTPEMGVTYNVTVPAGTHACYLAGEMTGWSHIEMTKVDDTHYTLTVDTATTAMKYKYCSGPDWKYVEKTATGEDVVDRTYSANDIVEAWASVYDPNATEDPTPEMGVTYNVTVPAGTYACYLAGEMNGWGHTEMTKVDDTHYTLTVDTATTAMKYKYCSGPDWDYVELQADGSDVQDRTYSENDEVAAWKKVYDPTSTPTPNPGDAKDITVKAKVPAEWTNGITVWVWPTGGAGSEATPTQEGEWYVYTQNCTELNIIFKNGTGWNGDANQTVDMTFTESTCIEITAGSGKATYVVVECDSNTATEDVVVRQVTQKLIYDGQVFLIRDGKMYNVLGQVIK